MNSKSRTAMYKRLNNAETAKLIVKRMVLAGNTVAEIKNELRELSIPVTAYNTLVNHGLVGKWRSQKLHK